MTRKESLTTRHLKRLSSSNNSDATMSSIPDEMIFCILENCRIFDILTSFQYVNKQFYEQCKIYIAQVQRRYVLFGSYRYDLQKHELKFIPHIIFPKLQSILSNMLTEHAQEQHLSTTNSFDPPTTAHPNTSQIHDHSHAKYFIPSHTMNLLVHFTTLSKHWRKGMNNFKYHSIHMPYDSLFAYPLLFSGNSKLSKGLFHHSHPLQDEFKIICVDLETFSCVRWSLDLEPYFPWEPIPLQVRQTFQNHNQLIIVLRRMDTTVVMALRKSTGHVDFIYNVTLDEMNIPTSDKISDMNVSTMNQSQQQQQQQQHHSVQFKWKRKSGNGGHSLVQQQSAITTTMNSVQESNSTKNTTHSKKRTFDCAVLTSNHIILSVYGIESSSTSTLISIHLTNFKIQTLAKWNRLTTTFNLTITDLENEYSQRQVNPPNRLFFDVRPQGSHVHFTCCHLEERELDVVAEERDHIISTSNHHSQNLLDVEHSCFEYTVPVMVGTRNLQVDFTCLGSEYWLMSGTEKQKLRTELVHLKSGQKIENSTNPLAMYMVEKDAKLVGLLSVEIYENHEMSFCPLIQNEKNEHGLIPQQVETSTTAVIGIPIWRTKIDDLSKFSYQPNVQNILLQDRLYVVVSGGHGIFLYCLNIQNGNLIWKQCLIESTATSHFSHFDVSCTLKRQVCTNTKGSSICIVGTLEEVAYFLMEFDAESGESRSLERKEYLHGWSNHENLVEQTQQALTRLKIQNDDHSEDDGMTTTHSSLLQHKKCVIC